MASAANNEGVFINIDLGDIREAFAAREKMKNPAPATEDAAGQASQNKDRAPNFVQSYLGKGMLLDVIV